MTIESIRVRSFRRGVGFIVILNVEVNHFTLFFGALEKLADEAIEG